MEILLRFLFLFCVAAHSSSSSIHDDLRSKAEKERADGARLIEDESDFLNTSTPESIMSVEDLDDRSAGCPYDAVQKYDLLDSTLSNDVWALECILGKTNTNRVLDGKNQKPVDGFLSNGLYIERKDDNGYTALHLAASIGDDRVIRMLGDAGADLNAPNNEGLTPLMTAVSLGYTSTVETLISLGVDLDVVDAGGNSAVILASAYGYERLVDILVKSGASTKIENVEGNTALSIASLSEYSKIVELLSELAGVDSTLEEVKVSPSGEIDYIEFKAKLAKDNEAAKRSVMSDLEERERLKKESHEEKANAKRIQEEKLAAEEKRIGEEMEARRKEKMEKKEREQALMEEKEKIGRQKEAEERRRVDELERQKDELVDAERRRKLMEESINTMRVNKVKEREIAEASTKIDEKKSLDAETVDDDREEQLKERGATQVDQEARPPSQTEDNKETTLSTAKKQEEKSTLNSIPSGSGNKQTYMKTDDEPLDDVVNTLANEATVNVEDALVNEDKNIEEAAKVITEVVAGELGRQDEDDVKRSGETKEDAIRVTQDRKSVQEANVEVAEVKRDEEKRDTATTTHEDKEEINEKTPEAGDETYDAAVIEQLHEDGKRAADAERARKIEEYFDARAKLIESEKSSEAISENIADEFELLGIDVEHELRETSERMMEVEIEIEEATQEAIELENVMLEMTDNELEEVNTNTPSEATDASITLDENLGAEAFARETENRALQEKIQSDMKAKLVALDF